MPYIPKSCRREGHGPSAVTHRRVWYAPWRRRVVTVCWVCGTLLTSAQATDADARYAPWWPR